MKTIISLSDTHSREENIILKHSADIIITAGDFTTNNTGDGIFNYLDWYSQLDIQYKIIVSGNSDGEFIEDNRKEFLQYCDYLNIIYLEDSSVIIDGIKIYGTPWTIAYSDNQGFGLKNDKKLYKKYKKIPLDTDILITHNPAYGILDMTKKYSNVGSKSLLKVIKKLDNLKIHFFGHIHEQSGIRFINNTQFVNCAYNKEQPYKIILL
jgi:Icc-related predicted phosphoesterase